MIKAIVLVTLAAAANCALLPSHSLVAPRQHQFGFQPKPTFHVQPTYQHVAPPGSEAYAQVLRSESVVNPESFKYSYETSNGIQGQEAGHLKQVGPQAAIATQGRFHWTSPEGQPIDISYVADENGYQPTGSAIPTPPPIPPQIARAIEYLQRVAPQQQQLQQQHQRPFFGRF